MGTAAPAFSGQGPVVVELYTSQGCSSCPPADAYLKDLSTRDDVIALSFHVDYWDYIGWKDIFASPQATARQRAYAAFLGERSVYTPQMIINGVTHEVGSRRRAVDNVIARELSATSSRLDVRADVDGSGVLTIGLPEKDYGGTATVWLIEYDRTKETNISRGENSGRTLENANVVRRLRSVGFWSGQAKQIRINKDDMPARGQRDGLVVMVQPEAMGPVLGVAQISLEN